MEYKKVGETTRNLIGNKIIDKINKLIKEFQIIYNKIIQKQLHMSMINKYLKKYLKKDIHLQSKDKELLIN